MGAAALAFLILVATGTFYYQFIVLPSLTTTRVSRNLTINVNAFQFGFLVNGSDTRNKPIEVFVGDNVTFIIAATFEKETGFAQHGFFIPGLMDQSVAVNQGKQVTVTIKPDKPGEFRIFCTIFCGSGHGNMIGLLSVQP